MKPIDCEPFYRNGLIYDLDNKGFVEDIPFYLRQIKKYGEPVLELACGTGRITIPLAERGYKITGLDISESMLSHAKRKAAIRKVDIDWVKADCRNFKMDKKFNLIYFPFNSLSHLHDLESIESCFSCVKMHLESEGRFVIDMFNPKLDYFTRDPLKRYPVTEYPDPYGRGTVIVTENNIYDAATQINRIKWYYKIGSQLEETVEELNLRIYYPQELDALLEYNGFIIENKFGEYDETSFASTSSKQLITCYQKK